VYVTKKLQVEAEDGSSVIYVKGKKKKKDKAIPVTGREDP
jgi:hypothetical protein